MDRLENLAHLWRYLARQLQAGGLDGDGAVGMAGDAGGDRSAVGLPDPVAPGVRGIDEEVMEEHAGGQ